MIRADKLVAARALGAYGAPALALAAAAVGIVGFIAPLFGQFSPESNSNDFVNHVALVAAARDTIQTTAGFPISTDAIYPGVEYPYFLFGNVAFWVSAAVVSLLLDTPPYIGAGVILAIAFAAGAWGMSLMATRAGLDPYLSAALGFLYASGPYSSVTLSQRFSFPEYVAWQALPLLLFPVKRSLRPEVGVVGVVGGALALAAPFYVHKLVAPQVALMLATLALNAAGLSMRTSRRLVLIGVIAVLMSVPAWLPWMRAFDPDIRNAFYPRDVPIVTNPSVVHLFWPYLNHSLPDLPSYAVYQNRLGLQVGVIPTVGFVAALWILARRPRSARRRLLVPSALFAIFAMLVVNLFDIWSIVPAALSYVQFSFRLIGIAHFVGFVLFLDVFAARDPYRVFRVAPALARTTSSIFVVLAAVSIGTYWHQPTLMPRASADIKPTDLSDVSRFFQRSDRGNLWTDRVVLANGWLAVPPGAAFLGEATAESVILIGTAPEGLFEHTSEPLWVRTYGFSKAQPEADSGELARRFGAWRRAGDTMTPIGVLLAEDDSDRAVSARDGHVGPRRVPDTDWVVTWAAEASIAGPGPFEMRAPLARGTAAVAIECSRAIAPNPTNTAVPADRPVCINVGRLVSPNNGDAFVAPMPIPIERRTRSAYGRLAIDARDLPPGHYQLPTFDYNFVAVQRPDGTAVSTYQHEGRTAIRHDGLTDAYAVGYELVPELLAPVIALVVLVLYAAARRLRVEVPAPSPGRWRTRRGESRRVA